MLGLGLGLHKMLKKPYFVLDDIDANMLYFSFSKIHKDDTVCIKVRRDSDNAEKDIGFKNNFLDIDDLLSFVGGGNGYVTATYAQGQTSSFQSNLSAQPLIVENGVYLGCAKFSGAQWLDTGVTRFGNTGLFADANEEFTVITVTKNEEVGTIIGRAASKVDNRTFQIYFSSTVTNLLEDGEVLRVLPPRPGSGIAQVFFDNLNLPPDKYLIFYELVQTVETFNLNSPYYNRTILDNIDPDNKTKNNTVGRKVWKLDAPETITKIGWWVYKTESEVHVKNFMVVKATEEDWLLSEDELIQKYSFISVEDPSRLRIVVRGVENNTSIYPSSEHKIITCVWDKSNLSGYINGEFFSLEVGSAEERTEQRIIVGERTNGTGGYPYKGDITAFIILDKALTTQERQKLENYLNQQFIGGN
jgi:hypothetical protein